MLHPYNLSCSVISAAGSDVDQSALPIVAPILQHVLCRHTVIGRHPADSDGIVISPLPAAALLLVNLFVITIVLQLAGNDPMLETFPLRASLPWKSMARHTSRAAEPQGRDC
jgi:hypothetical protein